MPHSVSSDMSVGDDGALPDAPHSDPPLAPEASAMQDESLAADEPASTTNERVAKKKTEVKLEDLFPDDEEDDEFTSSAPPSSNANAKVPSSPPLEPL